MVVTEKEGDYQCAMNFYLYDVSFEYEKQGMDRYGKLVEVLSEKKGVLSVDNGMGLLSYGCVNRDYENMIEFPVE